MSTDALLPVAVAVRARSNGTGIQRTGLALAVIALTVIVEMPGLSGLPLAGQRMLGILALAVVVWMTQALDYAVGAVVIGALTYWPWMGYLTHAA